MIQFYSPDIKHNCLLGPEEAHHCIKVLRRKIGDIISVTDGKGKRYECRIMSGDTRKLSLEIIREESVSKNWNFELTLAVAPTKNADRMAWLVEKATEIGVDKIEFIDCHNNERRHLNIERLKRNAISAMNQSLKTILPEIREMNSIDILAEYEGHKYFGYCDSETERLDFVHAYPGGNIIIAIGPEGDFTREEVDMLIRSGYKAVTFGDERLRTETAALYGVAATHILNKVIK